MTSRILWHKVQRDILIIILIVMCFYNGYQYNRYKQTLNEYKRVLEAENELTEGLTQQFRLWKEEMTKEYNIEFAEVE